MGIPRQACHVTTASATCRTFEQPYFIACGSFFMAAVYGPE
jgi:hypothetical protein